MNSQSSIPMNFYWPDDSDIGFWPLGQPDNGGTYAYNILYEGCVDMTALYGLNDDNCSHTYNFLCYIPN